MMVFNDSCVVEATVHGPGMELLTQLITRYCLDVWRWYSLLKQYWRDNQVVIPYISIFVVVLFFEPY